MTPVEEARYLILAAQREGNRQLARALRPLEVTPSQAEVLSLLAGRQPLTLSGLGELLVCESGTNPSRLVDRLVRAGLVLRAEDPQDRRHVELTLTSAGRRTAARIADIEKDVYRSIDAAATGHDIEAVNAFLRALVAGQPSGQAVARRVESVPAPETRRASRSSRSSATSR
ncbi:MarR family winged helix-turn-helix transcriptional regulator [Streptomyces sp. NBC_01803]|uniref:MarR family winged helix-turn-helix transcriptional regulator n=1 Tax=Streptomyces sp. NBC_01803 TaxID=2975946 RepID=UPI002DDAA9B4|nr:MarR family transcriptional regulator [Streptomyces sp. NBC_01803]WSA47337.1 MarR family transcriptional regulator [Streptomyces sp. NBC_01803]